MLRGFKNKFSKVGNIHFGKMFFALVLMFSMVVGGFDVVRASEPMYYYDVYSVKEELRDDHQIELLGKNYDMDQNLTTPDLYYYTGYQTPVGPNTSGLYTFGDSYKENYYYNEQPQSAVGRYISSNGIHFYYITKYVSTRTSGDSSQINYYWTFNVRYKAKLKGNLILTNAKGTYTQYPANGIHSNDLWYVRKGLANETPTLQIIDPSENSYFSKQNTV